MISNTPYEMSFESSPISLRELNDQLFSRKQQLEEKGYHCPWLLEDVGSDQPLLLTGGDLSDTFDDDGNPLGKALVLGVSKQYEDRLNFGVMVEYVQSKNEARFFGSAKPRNDPALYGLVQTAISEFGELTGIELQVSEE